MNRRLTLADLRAMFRVRDLELDAFRALHPVIAGGAPEGDDAGGDAGSGSGDDAGAGASGSGSDAGAGSGSDDGAGSDDHGADEAARLRAENQRLKREAAQREKDKRQAEKAAKEAADARSAEQGEWKKLAEERADKIRELEGTITERDRRDAERDQRTRVEQAAEKLNFRRPRRAFALLMDELGPEQAADTLADEQLTEAALKRLAKAEPELVDLQRRSGAPVNGSRGQATPEQEMADFLTGVITKQ